MLLTTIDWIILGLFFLVSLVIGLLVMKRSGKNVSEYFVGGKNMPWWLLGISMVATTFSTDTPNLVTDIVRTNGVSGNWVWFAFLITGMVTVFIYARLWKKSDVMTDIEFYELRYSGKAATFLRGFRSLYLGVFFNVIVMGLVSLAAIKIGAVLLGISPEIVILVSGIVIGSYTMLGGLRGILITDLFQFFIAMFGSVTVAVVALNHESVGGLKRLLAHPEILKKTALLPDFSNTDLLMTVFIVPLAVQWWAAWYPGAEPGGGGYIAQRMFAAKNENHAVGATFLFNIAHYAFRPWPWILVALASILVFPTLESIHQAFPAVPIDKLGHDLAYPAMVSLLPEGLLGLVLASLAAAYMSTISTHLNWGSSYIVNDFYKRFIDPNADDRKLVAVGRVSTLLLLILSGLFALFLQNAFQAFKILLHIGAGTGLLFLLRWFWWRINAISEIVAMLVSFLAAIYLELVHPHTGLASLQDWEKFLLGVTVTTTAWIMATYLGKPTDRERLIDFYRRTHPGGPGWRTWLQKNSLVDLKISKGRNSLSRQILSVFLGCMTVYGILFSIGFWLYSQHLLFGTCLLISMTSGISLIRNIRKH